MDESDEFCIVEAEEGSLPTHWSEVGITGAGRRVMKTFETQNRAKDYLQEMYGMYRDDGVVVPIDELDISWD
jgi:predicted DNA-binding WGR domain protein